VGTGKGITRLDPATGQVRQFTTAHGLANDFLTAAYRDRGGTLWFGTLRGLSRLDPRPERTRPPPVVAVAGIRIAGVAVNLPELGVSSHGELTIGPAENQVQIEYFGVGESLRFRYRLHGVDQGWTGPTDERVITYATLAPGTYRFEVAAVTPDGLASDQPATVTFTIQAPFWRRGWFIAAGFAVLATVVHAGYRLRLRRAVALERIRTRIATDLHDDIGSSLSQIAILSDLARRQPGTPETARTLTSIAATARESVDAMSDIVWALNPRRDSVVELAQRMRSVAAEALSARNIELVFTAPAAAVERGFDAELRRELLLVLKEALNNVLRHSRADRVVVALAIAGGRLTLSVADNGCGFEPAGATRGLGLASLRHRAERLQGRLTVESAAGRGTTVRLDVPLGRRRFFGA
jgi:signal transduction histidine kinase